MKNGFANHLKKILIVAVILSLLIIVLQIFNTVKTVENSKRSLRLVGMTALSSFEGGRKAQFLLNHASSTRFRKFIEKIGENTGVKSLYLFDTEGNMLFSTKDIPPPKFDFAEFTAKIIDTDEGLFIYRRLPPSKPMMMGGGRKHIAHGDDLELVAGALLDKSNYKKQVSSQIAFLFGMFLLEMLLIVIYIYTAKFLKSYTDQTKRLEASEYEAELGRMSRLMAHEIKNPLSTVKGLIEFSAKKSEGELKDISVSCVEELSRLDRIVNDYLSYGKDITLNTTEVKLREIAENTAKLLQIDARQKEIEIDINGDSSIKSDAEKMRQVIFNLLINAVQGAPEKSVISMDIHQDSLTVSNTISERSFETENLGKPFYTTKTVGTGLGLAIVKRIVQLHGFTMKIDTKDRFTVTIEF